MANWRKRLTSLASSVVSGVGDIASTATDDIGDTISRARSYLNQTAPAISTGLEGLANTGRWVGGNAISAAVDTPAMLWDLATLNPGAADERRRHPTDFGVNPYDPGIHGLGQLNAGVRDIGAPVREPLAFGARAALGDLDPGDSPFSDQNFAKAKHSVEGQDGWRRVLGMGVLEGLDLATDPKTYLPVARPVEGAGLLSKVGAHALNLPAGSFMEGAGARALGQAAERAAIFGFGSGAGSAAAEEYTNLNPTAAHVIGGLAGGLGASMLAERALGRSVSTLPEAIVPGDVARRQPGPVKLPDDPLFSKAVAATPGADMTADGLHLDLARFQTPEQAGRASGRTGVFYGSDSPDLRQQYGSRRPFGRMGRHAIDYRNHGVSAVHWRFSPRAKGI